MPAVSGLRRTVVAAALIIMALAGGHSGAALADGTVGSVSGPSDLAGARPAALTHPDEVGVAASVSPSAEASPTTGATIPPPGSPMPVVSSSLTSVARVGATILPGSAMLDVDYWAGDGSASFTVTVTNTGTVPETVVVTYTLPDDVTGAPGGTCQSTCTLSLGPAESRSITIAVIVGPGAWRAAPLTGTLRFTASGAGAQPVAGQSTWSVVFPPGPPMPGVTLTVSDVRLHPSVTATESLTLKIINTGPVPADGVLRVVTPTGVTVRGVSTGCRTHYHVNLTTLACGVGTLAPAARQTVVVSLSVPASVRASAPVAGLVRAALTPAGQDPATTQASYQILPAAGQGGVSASTSPTAGGGPPGPVAAQADQAVSSPLGPPAVVAPIIGGSLLVLVVVIISMAVVIRDRRAAARTIPVDPSDPADPAPRQLVAARDGPAAATAVISAGPIDRTPTPRGPIAWEWTPDPQITATPAETAPTPVTAEPTGPAVEAARIPTPETAVTGGATADVDRGADAAEAGTDPGPNPTVTACTDRNPAAIPVEGST